MKVNAEIISKFNPCKERFENFKKEYPNFNGDMHEFLNLENITYSDKVWVATRLLSNNQLVYWSILCAESVLHIFEEQFPNDIRVRNCLNTLKSISDFENMNQDEKSAVAYAAANAANAANAAYATIAANAAYAAATNAAYAAANAAYAAATNAAYAAANAVYAAANAAYATIAANAAYYAVNAAYANDANNIEEQRNLNLLLLSSLIEVENEI